MKSKIIFLVCAVFLTVACEKEQHTGKESRVSVTVYDENGKAMPGVPVKMYDEKDYKAFEQDNLTPPTAGATANAQGIALFTLPGETWFSGQSQRFLTFVVQEGGGPDNYRIWSVGKTIDAGKDIQLEIRCNPPKRHTYRYGSIPSKPTKRPKAGKNSRIKSGHAHQVYFHLPRIIFKNRLIPEY